MSRSRTSRPRRENQSGIGVVLVLGVGLLVIGMGFVAHRIFDGAVSSSTSHVTYEQALHLAEHGIDQTLARLQKDRTYSNAAGVPDGVVAGSAEKTWLLGQIANATPERAPQGEFVTIKPVNRNVIYGASWIPNRANAKRTRIVKAEYLLSSFSPSHAVLTGGDLIVTGNPTISGAGGNVHSNGDLSNNDPGLDISGSPTVSGGLTTSGQLQVSGAPSVGGTLAGGQPLVDIPAIDPLEVWNRHAKSATYTASWYDLCPDATVRTPDGTAPCQGTVIADTSSGTQFRGFRFSGGNWGVSGDDGSYHGIYYAHESGIRISGNPATKENPWRTTLIASGAGSCPSIQGGDVVVSGNPNMTGLLGGLLILAGRDATISGNPNQVTYDGLIAAHEQIEVSGTPDVYGAILAEDACDSSGTNRDKIIGNPNIVYNGALEVPIGNVIRTTLWLEI